MEGPDWVCEGCLRYAGVEAGFGAWEINWVDGWGCEWWSGWGGKRGGMREERGVWTGESCAEDGGC